jgi:hypothetical protein
MASPPGGRKSEAAPVSAVYPAQGVTGELAAFHRAGHSPFTPPVVQYQVVLGQARRAQKRRRSGEAPSPLSLVIVCDGFGSADSQSPP